MKDVKRVKIVVKLHADRRHEQQLHSVKCQKEGCSNNAADHGFCGKHYTERMKFEEQTKSLGMKTCSDMGVGINYLVITNLVNVKNAVRRNVLKTMQEEVSQIK